MSPWGPRIGIILLFLLIAARLSLWKSSQGAIQTLCSQLDSVGPGETVLEGVLVRNPTGSELRSVAVAPPSGGQSVAIPGRVWLKSDWGQRTGSRLRLAARPKCLAFLRNPGRTEDGLNYWQPPRLSLSAPHLVSVLEPSRHSLRVRLRENWRKWLVSELQAAPVFTGLVVAVWLGELSALPPWLIEQYTDSGLLQLLALSGQHVVCLSILAALLARLGMAPFCFFLSRRLRKSYSRARTLIPLFVAGFLWFTAVENPPIFRALVMTAAMTWLRLRGMNCGPVQLLTSSAAALLLWDPSLLARPGFFLSAAATGVLGLLIFEGCRQPLRHYLFLSLGMPVLFFPLSAFFFAKVAWVAPLYSVLVGWLWDLVLLPVAFLAPFVIRLLPVPFALNLVHALERGWILVLTLHQSRFGAAEPYFLALRPTWIELLGIELLILLLVLGVKNRFFPRSL